MALPTKINNQYGGANIEENGGKGSGNFGHSGRPGYVGGSSSSGGLTHATTSKEKKEEEYKSIIKEEATLKGAGKGRRSIKDIAKQFDKDPADVEQDIDDFSSISAKTKKDSKTNPKTDSKYSVKDGKEARKYLTADSKMSISSSESFGFTYDELGKPTRLSRFEKDADDKLWSAWASMQKVQDDGNLGDVRGEGLATAGDAMRLAKAVISTSQTAYLPSEREAAKRQTEQFVKGVKDEVKRAKITLTADAKRYGDTEVRKATRKALDNISSAMDGFLGYENPSREYKD